MIYSEIILKLKMFSSNDDKKMEKYKPSASELNVHESTT